MTLELILPDKKGNYYKYQLTDFLTLFYSIQTKPTFRSHYIFD